MERHEFKLQGLTLPGSFTCKPLYKEDHFWAKSNMTLERFQAFFDYFGEACKKLDGSGQNFTVIIEHDGLTEDGTPINPIVIEIKDNN